MNISVTGTAFWQAHPLLVGGPPPAKASSHIVARKAFSAPPSAVPGSTIPDPRFAPPVSSYNQPVQECPSACLSCRAVKAWNPVRCDERPFVLWLISSDSPFKEPVSAVSTSDYRYRLLANRSCYL
ncbi:hypothetical protein BJ508DRAFT_417030 [Ascobolus immersus RN42]|uniref:Uncharacterized protein n=1 Tax=Ascobolus immersus RN42 TaxID=1160509 RepID=A0A3N4HZX0_ASCIM|nr:hypothetical protein BJ508DRAFT_417030 [Ascobolus immersus RN42]